MVVVVFRSRLRPEAGEEYLRTAQRMEELAARQTGFRSFKGFTADDGERVAIAEFDSAGDAAAWGENPEHREAQRRGRELFYSEYRLQICEVLRDRAFGKEGVS